MTRLPTELTHTILCLYWRAAREGKRPPNIPELMRATGVSSSVIAYHLDHLVSVGALMREPRNQNTIRLREHTSETTVTINGAPGRYLVTFEE